MSKLEAFAKERGVKYFLVNFTDLSGIQRSKLVPTPAIAEMEENGAGFAGFAVFLDMPPSDADMFAMPDPNSVVQLPWRPEVAWVASDLHMNGAPVAQAPRNVLKKMVAEAASKGYRMKTGVEAEYHLLSEDGQTLSDPRDVAAKPCYDQQAVMRRFDVISEICDAMIAEGWAPYQNDHEDANGQFEMNWDYADALVTADRHAFFRFMVKSVAENHGVRATFMPKPFMHLTGNGCHMHVSLWDEAGTTNLFDDANGELGLSGMAYNFLGGILKNASGMCALTNPTVNSYKRLNAPMTASGATWSPNTISYTGNNRTHMVRIPDPGRFELRLADGAANPYLLPAAVLAAGLYGIDTEADPGKRLDMDMYTSPQDAPKSVKKLPLYLIDAIREFGKNKVLADALGSEFCDAYVTIKQREWDEYSRSLTDWERHFTLDC